MSTSKQAEHPTPMMPPDDVEPMAVAREPLAQVIPISESLRLARSRRAPSWEKPVARLASVVDTVAVFTAVAVAYVVKFDFPVRNAGNVLAEQYLVLALLLMVGWLIALRLADARNVKLMGAGPAEYIQVTNATLAFFGAVAIISYVAKFNLGRGFVAIALPSGILLLALGRWILRKRLQAKRASGEYVAKALVIGGVDGIAHLQRESDLIARAGLQFIGACIPTVKTAREVEGLPVLGSLSQSVSLIEATQVDAVVITGSDEITPAFVKQLSWDLEPLGVDLVLAPALTDIAGARIHTRPVSGLPLLHVEAPGFSGPQHRLKRLFDIAGSLVLILLMSVPLALTALAIKLTSRGPVLFKQERIGLNGEPFPIYKFRSMVVGADARLEEVLGEGNVGVFYKPKDDPRITPVGRFIRRYSIDELPQLFNVLEGTMSLVGPRPQVAKEVEQYDDAMTRRLLVKPGMTGLWQVSGRNDLSLEESMRLDLYYVENWSFAGDLLILLRTMRAVVGSDGAY